MKNKAKKSKGNFIYFAFMFIFILGGSFYLIYKYNNFLEYNNQILMLEQEIQAANEEKQELLNQMEYQTSNEYIEKIAREQLGMVKSDEIIFIDRNK